CMRPRPVPFARQDSAGRRSEDAAARAWQSYARRAFYRYRARTACARARLRHMKLSRTFAIVLRHFYLMRGSPARVLPLFAWVGIDMVLWGFITKYLNTITSAGFDFVPVLLGAVLLWDFFMRVMHGV